MPITYQEMARNVNRRELTKPHLHLYSPPFIFTTLRRETKGTYSILRQAKRGIKGVI
jgi:hypothetical protein